MTRGLLAMTFFYSLKIAKFLRVKPLLIENNIIPRYHARIHLLHTPYENGGIMTDAYAVAAILQEMERAQSAITWKVTNGGGYVASLLRGGQRVSFHLYQAQDRTGTYAFLDLATESYGTVTLIERLYHGFLERRDESSEKYKLEELMKRLYAAVSRQCAERKRREEETIEERKQAIYQILFFGNPPQ